MLPYPHTGRDVEHMSSLQFLANQAAPPAFGSMVFAEDGTPQRREPGTLQFRFSFGGWGFSATAESQIDGSSVTVETVLGGIPYTAEGINRRIDVLAILAASRRGLPNGVIEIDSGRMLRYRGRMVSSRVLAPVSILSTATELVITAQPWLSLLSLYLAAPAPAPAPRRLMQPA